MEASLPISAAVRPVPLASASTTPVARLAAPSVGLPLAFILTGLLSLCVAVGWLVARPALLAAYHYNQFVIAATHLFVLGWLASLVMGAMYQLVPVALETRLYSERLAKAHWALHLVGFAGMVWMFNSWNLKQVGHFGSVLVLGLGLFVYNLGRTLLRVPKWNVTASAVAAALAWLSLTVAAGLSLAVGKCAGDLADAPASDGLRGLLVHSLQGVGAVTGHFNPVGAMHAHAHLGGIGFFTLLIVGVSYKLIPMFTLSEVQSRRRAAGSVILLNIGLCGCFLTLLLRSAWKLAFALVIIAALILYGIELAAILKARKRRVLDWGVKTFLTAVALLLPLSGLAVVLSWPSLPLTALTGQLENLYGFLGLVGVVSFAVIGMLYKIIPFLVWFGTYSRKVGLAQVPSLADLYSQPLQITGYIAFVSGLAVTSAAIVLSSEAFVRCGGLLLGTSLLTLLINVALMLSHFFRPKLKPLPSRPASRSNRL